MDFVIYKCVIIGIDIRNRQLLQIHMTPNRKNSSGFISSVPAVFQIFNKFYISFRRNKTGLMVY